MNLINCKDYITLYKARPPYMYDMLYFKLTKNFYTINYDKEGKPYISYKPTVTKELVFKSCNKKTISTKFLTNLIITDKFIEHVKKEYKYVLKHKISII